MLYCPTCNVRLEQHDDFCPNCGTSLKKTDKENYSKFFAKRQSIKNRPVGYIILVGYETIFGLLLILLGFYLFSFFNTNLILPYFIIGSILILVGGSGIAGAIFILKWKNEGYILSDILLISTGVLFLFAYLIPTLAMLVFLFYLYHE